MMKYHYPTPQEIGVSEARGLLKERYEAGFEHGMRGGQLDRVEHFRLSFRKGFRAAKLYLKALRKQQGIVNFPVQGRLKIRAF